MKVIDAEKFVSALKHRVTALRGGYRDDLVLVAAAVEDATVEITAAQCPACDGLGLIPSRKGYDVDCENCRGAGVVIVEAE